MTRREVLIVGEDFGNSDVRGDRYALTGSSGRRLAMLAFGEEATEHDEAMTRFILHFARTNVVDEPEDWTLKARVLLGVRRAVEKGLVAGRVVLLGSKVAAAFGVASAPMFEWRPGSELVVDQLGMAEVDPSPIRFARSPHPSGRSHWWNDRENVVQAREFWRELGR